LSNHSFVERALPFVISIEAQRIGMPFPENVFEQQLSRANEVAERLPAAKAPKTLLPENAFSRYRSCILALRTRSQKNISEKEHPHRDLSTALRSGRDDKGEDSASGNGSCWIKAVLHNLGRAKGP
jgi:hypothetical protein